MERIEYRYQDKSEWGAGPWQDEPDKIQWPDATTGLPCLIVRNNSGALCGYVGVSEGHPLFGIGYSDCHLGDSCPERIENGFGWCEHTPGANLRAHGGITFADFCVESGKEHGICHVPGPGEPDRVWWFGFDCAHAGDQCPAHDRYGYGRDGEWYCDVEYVQGECAILARQLAEPQP